MAVIDHRRMALHAMRDGRDIEAALDGRVEIGGRHLLVGAGGNIDVHHGLVDRRLHLVAHWRDRSYISNDGIEIARGEDRSEEHTSELQSLRHLVCRLLLEKKKHTK